MNFPIDIALYDAEFKRREVLRNAIRSRLGCDEKTIVLCITGKLVDWKRQRDAVAAIVNVKKAGIRLKLIILGSGPEESNLRAFAKEVASQEVHFAGFVPPQDLPSYYAASDVYLHTSKFEPHSLAISEAIYMGLPAIISSTCGSYGPNDDVQPGRNGYVYPLGEVSKLAEYICKVARDSALRARFGEVSRQYAVAAQKRSHGQFLEEALTADCLL
jgi:glycosyltransferase involved in cell wall biosynthesis